MNSNQVKKISERLKVEDSQYQKVVTLKNGNTFTDGLTSSAIIVDQENSIMHHFGFNKMPVKNISKRMPFVVTSFDFDAITEIAVPATVKDARKIAEDIARETGMSEERIESLLKIIVDPLKEI